MRSRGWGPRTSRAEHFELVAILLALLAGPAMLIGCGVIVSSFEQERALACIESGQQWVEGSCIRN